jgi:hypothetical protein
VISAGSANDREIARASGAMARIPALLWQPRVARNVDGQDSFARCGGPQYNSALIFFTGSRRLKSKS